MKLPDAPWQRREGMTALLSALEVENGKARFVGGAVRDALLGHDVSDVDVATVFAPEEVMRRLKEAGIRAVPTGIDHGTVTAVLAGGPVEITTLRRDVSTDGRRATVAFSEDWREDAARRDFTINALSADPLSRDIHDYFGGLQDLESRTVRFIGDPLQRIAEDHLRILRFFRFHARFGEGAPDEAALDACVQRANDLMALSRERIADELLKLLALPSPAVTLRLMVERGVLKPVLPEIGLDGVARLDRLAGREQVLVLGPDPLRRLAALLPPDPEIATSVAARLRLSNKALKRLASAACWREQRDEDPRLLAYAIGREEALDRLLLGEDNPGLAAAVEQLRGWERPGFPIGGGELIRMGLTPGPLVARTLQALERDWARGGFSGDVEQVRAMARDHVRATLGEST
jgi:poly(A) polymerase